MEDNQTPPTTSYEFSDGQDIVFSVLMICSASLSVIGSSTLLFKILRDRAQNGSWTPYDRIIFGLSSTDVFSSITMAINPFLLPRETASRVWAFGNPTTCRAHAFLLQICVVWSRWYNAILSFYFLFTVLSQVRGRGKNFVQKCEPWMHLSGIYLPITAIISLRHGWYGLDDQGGCSITDKAVRLLVAGIPMFLSLFAVIINNIVIYAVVRKSLRSPEHVEGTTLAQKQIKREAVTLMILYVAGFLLTLLPAIIVEILVASFGDADDNRVNALFFFLHILMAILMPLQGFFNAFIYLKPAYTRFRAANPNKPMGFVLNQALFNPEVPQLTVLSDQSPSNVIAEGDGGIITDPGIEEDAKEEDIQRIVRRKVPRKFPRKKRVDSDDDDDSSDSSA